MYIAISISKYLDASEHLIGLYSYNTSYSNSISNTSTYICTNIYAKKLTFYECLYCMGVDILRLTCKKILAVAPRKVICHCARFIRERCRLSRLRYFSKAVSLQIDMKYNWQRASAESRDSSGMPRNKSPCIMTGLGTTAKSLRFCLQFRCFHAVTFFHFHFISISCISIYPRSKQYACKPYTRICMPV